MTKLIVDTDDPWTPKKLTSLLFLESELLKRNIGMVLKKIQGFENKYGSSDRGPLYGRVDDMELIEWEGEIETLQRLKKKLKSLEEISIEYK